MITTETPQKKAARVKERRALAKQVLNTMLLSNKQWHKVHTTEEYAAIAVELTDMLLDELDKPNNR